MNATLRQLLRRALRAADSTSVMTTAEREQTLKDIQEAVEESPKWWVVLLKVLAYAIGLILAGYGTTAVALTFLAL